MSYVFNYTIIWSSETHIFTFDRANWTSIKFYITKLFSHWSSYLKDISIEDFLGEQLWYLENMNPTNDLFIIYNLYPEGLVNVVKYLKLQDISQNIYAFIQWHYSKIS